MRSIKSVGTLENLNQFLCDGKVSYRIIPNLDMYFREENHSKISSYTFNLIYEREFPSEIPIEIIPFLQELCDRELLLWYDDLDGFSWISHKKEIEVFIKEKVPKKYNSLIKNTIRQYSIQEKD